MKTLKIAKTCVLLVAAWVVVVASTLPASAEDFSWLRVTDNIGSVQDVMGREAEAQLYAHILISCMAGGVDVDDYVTSWHDDGSSVFPDWNDLKSPSLIFNRGGNDLTIDVGYFAERALQGGSDDARIKCSDKIDSLGSLDGQIGGGGTGNGSIFTRFTNILGLPDKKYLFCDVNDQGQVVGDGIFRAKGGKVCGDSSPDTDYTRNGNPSGGDGETCISIAHGGVGAWFMEEVIGGCETVVSYDGYEWYEHIKKLYNEAAEKYGWEHGFDTVGYYYGTAGYYMYRNEMYIRCGLDMHNPEQYDEKPSTFDNGMYLIDVKQTKEESANIKYTYIPQDNKLKHSFVSKFNSGDKYCKDMIERANEEDIYGQYRERMKFVLNTLCERSMTERYNEASSTDIPEDTKTAYAAAKADTSNYSIGQFIEAIEANSETTGWKCRDIGVFYGAEQEDPTLDDDIVDSNDQEDCYNKAGSLGWVICPLITTGAEMVQTTYEGMVVPFLRMNPRLFAQDNGTYVAWNIFRNFANIAFVIIFLVVIFSQLTGYGIDNYGIKKILPKLIVSAILINMSYIICQLAIDIANIVGSGVGSIFTGIGDMVMHDAPSVCDGACNAVTAGSGGGAGTWIALIAVVVAITAVAVLAIGPQILIPVLLGIISFVVAIFFLFVILGIRQALAVLLVAASPLAFVCYMLPNTKRIFDKWFSSLKGLLIAYPVCSAMVYGGDMVAKIILSAYGTEATDLASLTPILSAGVIAVAPIFLIPGVIKKSMAGIGNLSARLQGGLTHRARGAADRRLQNSPLTHRQRYREKARMDRANARMGEYNNRRAGRVAGRLENRVRSGKASASQQRAYLSAVGMQTAYNSEQQKAFASSFDNASPAEVASSFSNMVKSGKYDKNLASAAIQKLSDSNQHDVLNNMLDSMDANFMHSMSKEDKTALGNQLAGLKKDNIAAGLYGKHLAASGGESDLNLKNYMGSHFTSDVRNAGKDIISSQDDSALSYIAENGGSFTAEQMRNSIGNLDTKQQNQMQGLWSNMSDADRAETFTGMSTEQYAKVDENVAKAVGGGSVEAGRDFINSNTTTQRQALMSDEGEKIRAGQTASQQAMSDWSKAGAAEKARVMNGKDWSSLSSSERDAYYNSMPQHAGESNADYQARVISSYTASAAKTAAKAAGYRV